MVVRIILNSLHYLVYNSGYASDNDGMQICVLDVRHPKLPARSFLTTPSESLTVELLEVADSAPTEHVHLMNRSII